MLPVVLKRSGHSRAPPALVQNSRSVAAHHIKTNCPPWTASARSAIIRQPIAIILESPMGVQHYVATLKLTPVTDGARCLAELSAEFECDAELIGQGVFQAGFDASRRRFMR